jgi:hypothetical protein
MDNMPGYFYMSWELFKIMIHLPENSEIVNIAAMHNTRRLKISVKHPDLPDDDKFVQCFPQFVNEDGKVKFVDWDVLEE